MAKKTHPLSGAAAGTAGAAIGAALQKLYPTTSAKGRMIRLGALTAGVTGSYIGYMLQRVFLGEEQREKKRKAVHAHMGRRIRDELMMLRGPAMKFGQALSLHTDILPEDLLTELSKLQMEAPGMHPSLAEAQFRASLGRAPQEVFKSFEPDSFAAASLGQVHRATLRDGTAVAVKIQYPEIRTAIENDFRWVRNTSLPVQLSGHLSRATLDEMESQILAETDYEREADNLAFFRRRLQPLGFVSVPEVFGEYSSGRVLTMSIARGQHLDAFLATKPSQALRDTVGSRLFELFWYQVIVLERLHADPHWGNYLFNTDGSIGLIDFGCVKEFGSGIVTRLRKGILFPGDFDSPEFHRIIEDQFTGPGRRLTRAGRRAVIGGAFRFYRQICPPDRPPDWRFDFSDAAFLRELASFTAKCIRAKVAAPEYVFLMRAEVGLYSTLHRLRARVPTSGILRRLLGS